MLHLEHETLQELLTFINEAPGIETSVDKLLKGIESLLPSSEGARVTLDLRLNPDKTINLAIDVAAKNFYILSMDASSCLPDYIPGIWSLINKPVNIEDLLALGDKHPITIKRDPSIANGVIVSSPLDE